MKYVVNGMYWKPSILNGMTKKFLYLLQIEDDDDKAPCSDYKIIATDKNGKKLRCGICTPDKYPCMSMMEVIDDDRHENPPYIAH